MEVCASVRFKAHRGVYIDVTRAMLHDARPSIEKCKEGSPERERAAQLTIEGVEPDESTTIRLVIVRILCDICSGWVSRAEKGTRSRSQDVSVTRTYRAS